MHGAVLLAGHVAELKKALNLSMKPPFGCIELSGAKDGVVFSFSPDSSSAQARIVSVSGTVLTDRRKVALLRASTCLTRR